MMPESSMEEDHALIQAFGQGDETAFPRLVQKYRRQIYGLAFRFTHNHEEADDLAQETFLRAYTHLSSFRGESSFKTWLFRIVTNLSINLSQSSRMAKDTGEEPEEHHVQAEASALEDLLAQDRSVALQRAIATLPPKQKETLLLKTYQDLTCEQVAQVMKCSVGTVKANLFNALKKLKQALAPGGTHEKAHH
jgi:RNA polymerase sigma-70 factor (ECF subfamily)